MDGNREGFDHGGFREWQVSGQWMDDASRHGYVLGKSSIAPIFGGGDPEHFATLTQVDVAAAAIVALAAINSGVERDGLAFAESLHGGSHGRHAACGLMAHDDGRDAPPGSAIESMNITAANATGLHANEDFVSGWARHGQIHDF